MLKSKKHVFWEALIITIAVFIVGLFLGMMIEVSNSNKIGGLYTESEISLVDALAITQSLEKREVKCEVIKEKNIQFADEIYKEAKLLENYESSGKLTDNLKILHRKYDLLRTLLWMANQESLERCKQYNLIVYLYEYETEDAQQKAKQNVWSKILLDLKSEEEILLIPIATDQHLTSLDIILAGYNLERMPAIIVNNQKILYEVETTDDIKKYLRT